LLFRAKDWLESQDYHAIIPKQGGRAEQPDMLAYSKVSGDLGGEIAVEVETSANHPEQIVKNYKKNARLGRFVVFVVPDEDVENKVKECLKDVGEKYRIFLL
jgi:hypothetical protein